MKTRSWSSSVGIMLVPSTFTGWYRKTMKNADTASEIRMSRTHLANTGRMRPRAVRLSNSGVGGCVPMDGGTLDSVGVKLMDGLGARSIIENTVGRQRVALARSAKSAEK